MIFIQLKQIASYVSKPHNYKIFDFEVFAFLFSKQHNSTIYYYFTLFLYFCYYEDEQSLLLIPKCTSFLLIMFFDSGIKTK